MRLLVHVCCAPCFVYPYFDIRDNSLGFPLSGGENNDVSIEGYFYNPNIHPYKEFEKRMNTLKNFTQDQKIEIIYEQEYGLYEFLEKAGNPHMCSFQERYQHDLRCEQCYKIRLEKTAQYAEQNNFNAFTTTLLISPYQNHDLIKIICEELSQKYKIDFFYKDWRPFYKQGVELSKKYKMYRQQYCGCVFSEYERYSSNKGRSLITLIY